MNEHSDTQKSQPKEHLINFNIDDENVNDGGYNSDEKSKSKSATKKKKSGGFQSMGNCKVLMFI